MDRIDATAANGSVGLLPVSKTLKRMSAAVCATSAILAELGYRFDLSLVPHTDLSADGGPDFRGLHDRPFWWASAH